MHFAPDKKIYSKVFFYESSAVCCGAFFLMKGITIAEKFCKEVVMSWHTAKVAVDMPRGGLVNVVAPFGLT